MINAYIGALIGDINGSKYEFHNTHDYNFELFQKNMHMTDDSLLTLAVMDVLTSVSFDQLSEDLADDIVHGLEIEFTKKFNEHRPRAGFGGGFYRWCKLPIEDKRPYGSYGNGSAMRVSPVAYVADSLFKAEWLAAVTASVTHDHREGVKGAKATAAAIYMSLHGSSKEDIKNYIKERYYPHIDQITYGSLKEYFPFNETCQKTVPEAITVFLESNDFEDCLRKAVSLGGDCDTVAAIACSIASAFYKEGYSMESILPYLREEDKETLSRFDQLVSKFEENNKNSSKDE